MNRAGEKFIFADLGGSFDLNIDGAILYFHARLSFSRKRGLRGVNHTCQALTLLELVLSMVMITIIFAAILPQFAAIRNNWDKKQGSAEALQNGRVLMDHISRNLSKAKRIIAVSASAVTNGYIQFVDYNDFNDRYDIAPADSYVEYGVVGSLSDLAGPVNSFKFTCYDANITLLSPVTDTNLIRLVKVDAAVDNSASNSQDKTFTTWAYLRTNGQSQTCWQHQDIGSVAATGSATFADCNWTVMGSGADIWNNTDGFHYVYQSLSGDGQIVARVVSITNTNAWAKAGVMIRETLTGGSKHAMMVVTPGSGNSFQRRLSTNGASTLTAGSAVTAPYWVKLTRRGNTLTGYESPNGSTWTQVGADTVTMVSDVYIGLAVTSHNDGTLCTANFDNISFITYDGLSTVKNPSDSNVFVTIPTPATNVNDLLIAAVATDGSVTISPPSGWTQIDQGSDSGNQITLGAWWRFAVASEPASHQFVWTGGEKAYGWMMRFKGQNLTSPINALSSASSSGSATPTSPAVTTTTNCCQILRLGAFDNSNINVGNPGLSGNSPITMDASGGGAATVGILGDGWQIGTTHAKQSGTARALVFIAHAKGNSSSTSLTGVTYGGRAMTKVTSYGPYGAGSNRVYIAAFILNDADITAATDTTFVPTWVSAPTYIAYTSAFLQNVNQTTLTGSTNGNGASGFSVSTSSLATNNGNMVIENAVCTSTGAYTANNGFTMDVDLSVSNFDGMDGHKSATGVNETPSVNHDVSGNNVLIGFVVNSVSAAGGTVSGGAGYVRQSLAGDSGTSTFSLTASDSARMLTIAIAPSDPTSNACCQDNIIP